MQETFTPTPHHQFRVFQFPFAKMSSHNLVMETGRQEVSVPFTDEETGAPGAKRST